MLYAKAVPKVLGVEHLFNMFNMLKNVKMFNK